MVYAAAVLFLSIFFLLLKMRSSWEDHENRQDARLKDLEEQLMHAQERLKNLEAIEADLGPLDNMRNRGKDRA